MNPVSILLVALAVIVIGALLFWMPQRRKLKLRIEPVSAARLDPTPERSEIISEVRVREREQEADEPVPASIVPTPAVAPASVQPAHEPPVAAPVEPELETGPEPVPAPATKLEQADLFADQPVAMPTPGSDQPVFAPDLEGAVDPLAGHDDSQLGLPDMDRVLSLHVMAVPGRPIAGRRLLELLLQYGLRYGDMSIFHRHEHPAGQGKVLFSLAQAVEPGTFDILQMERQNVPGISLFMGLPGYKRLHAFDLMVDTARRLAKELDADLLDDQAQPATSALFETWREEVIEAERQSLSS